VKTKRQKDKKTKEITTFNFFLFFFFFFSINFLIEPPTKPGNAHLPAVRDLQRASLVSELPFVPLILPSKCSLSERGWLDVLPPSPGPGGPGLRGSRSLDPHHHWQEKALELLEVLSALERRKEVCHDAGDQLDAVWTGCGARLLLVLHVRAKAGAEPGHYCVCVVCEHCRGLVSESHGLLHLCVRAQAA